MESTKQALMTAGEAYMEGHRDAASMLLHYLRGAQNGAMSRGKKQEADIYRNLRADLAVLFGVDDLPG